MGESARFGGGANESYVHPAIAVVVLVACVLMLVLRRKYVIFPFLFAGLLIPFDQVIVVGPFHFMMLRIVILFGWIRLFAAKFSSGCGFLSGGMNAIDKALTFMVISSAATFILLWQDWGAVINQLGTIYTVCGIYFLFRFFIRDDEDVDRTIRALAYTAVVIAAAMAAEKMTGHNVYAVFGGARQSLRENAIERDNVFRAMGPFGHPILAGTFGAISMPLFVGLWWKARKNRVVAFVGVIAATVIVITSASSTPILAYAAAILGLCLWPIRKSMRRVRWGMVASLFFLQMVMKAPVWALIARVDVIGGSSGNHRFALVDQFIRRFGDWWLLGTKTNAQWGWDMWDLANEYVAVGEVSGLLPFIFFLAIIVFGFKYLGRARKAAEGNKVIELFSWALCAALFANVVAFFGISYFDQTIVAWYALLAMISTAAAPHLGVIVSPEDQDSTVLAKSHLIRSCPTEAVTRKDKFSYQHGRQLKSPPY